MTQEQYLETRVNDQISWMENKSRTNQLRYKRLKLVEIISAALIPFLAGFHQVHSSFSILTGFLGFFIVVINGVQQLQRYHENWLAYRTTSEALKREKILFECGTEPYDQQDALKKFIQNFEALLADENKVWKSAISKMPEVAAH